MLNRLLGILILAASLALGWLWSDYRQFLDSPLDVSEDGLVYTLPKGGNAASVARDMVENGVLDNLLYFRLMARSSVHARRLQAGEYRIPAGLKPEELLALLASGQVIQYPVTLIEGQTFRQWRSELAKNDKLANTLAEKDDAAVMQLLGRPGVHPEGRFLPDTYLFPRGVDDSRVLRRAMQAMDELLDREWAGRQDELPLKTMDEALILASIVEKETGLAEERQRIAGVFVRRLRKGMKLQTDPTVIYGMGEAFDGNIRRADLRRDTPYNTYVHTGLPPTPIAMPGAEAIRAALHPADGNELYFVATGDGGHKFSATLTEHNAAVRKYQLRRRNP
jgi:UPF0755 protein